MLEAQTGVLCHDGETGEKSTRTARNNDTLTLFYDGEKKTLDIAFDDEVMFFLTSFFIAALVALNVPYCDSLRKFISVMLQHLLENHFLL